MADRYILAVESSCDETSVAVLKNEKELLSNIIASQVESHKRFGGVVPEVASRHHVEVVTLCIGCCSCNLWSRIGWSPLGWDGSS